MASTYGQYCPLSLAAELLCERWTLLVISRILSGCTRFNEIHRGVPRMSPSLLSQRLAELESAGILHRRRGPGGTREYRLTRAGYELEGIVQALASWGQAWARDLDLDDLDPAFLVWSMHARVDSARMPPGRTVVEFALSGAPDGVALFWLVHRDGAVEMCLKDPGLDVDLVVTSDLRLFVEAWRGIRDLRHEIRLGRIRLDATRNCETTCPAGSGPTPSPPCPVGAPGANGGWRAGPGCGRRGRRPAVRAPERSPFANARVPVRAEAAAHGGPCALPRSASFRRMRRASRPSRPEGSRPP